MPSILITGANRGLGLEFSRQYAADGWRVFATCRQPERAKELARLGDTVTVHRLDVDDRRQIEALAAELRGKAVDVLLNNAGVYGPKPQDLDDSEADTWSRVLRVNTIAPLVIARAFLDHVARSQRRLIVSITSLLGSIAENTSGGIYMYRSSKAALNAAMKSLACDLRNHGVTVVVLHPGWVRTDMGGREAPLKPKDSIAGMRRVIERLGPSDTGRFYDHTGAELPW